MPIPRTITTASLFTDIISKNQSSCKYVVFLITERICVVSKQKMGNFYKKIVKNNHIENVCYGDIHMCIGTNVKSIHTFIYCFES